MSTVTTVNSTALHLIEVDKNVVKSTFLASLISGDDIISRLLQSYIGNLSSKMETAVRYAKGHYTLGLPEGQSTQINIPTKLEIADAIRDAIAHPFDILVYKFISTDYKPYYEVLDFLTNSRAYDFTTNTIGVFPGLSFSNGQQMYISGSSVSVNGFDIIVSYEYWGPVEFLGSVEGVAAIQYEFSKISTHSETINRPSAINTTYGDGCLIASYKKLNLDGSEQPTLYNWIYRTNSNLYPELDHQRSTTHVSEYLPVVPLRYDKKDYTAVEYRETDLYKTSKQLLKILKIPINKLGEQIKASPSINDIDQAYVMFGADLQSKNIATLAYLNHYFDLLGSLNTTIYSASVSSNATLYGRYLYENNTFTEHGLSLSMSFSSITTSYIPGCIDDGKIDNARKTIEYTTYPDTYENSIEGFPVVTAGYTTTTLILDLQVTALTMRRVIVKDLVVVNHIDGSYVVTATLDKVKDDPANHNMIIPLEHNICLWLKAPQRNELYTDCALLIINAIDRRDLEWYEESWFAPLITIAAMIIAVATFQPWLAWAALATTTTTMIVTSLLIMVLSSIAISLATNWLIDKYGKDLGIIGAAILAVVAIVLSRGTSGITIGATVTKFTLTYAQLALQIATALISSTNEFILAKTQKIIDEYNLSAKLIGEAQEALDTKAELEGLDLRADFNPLAFTRPNRYYTVPNESPDKFFNRTLNLSENTYYGVHGAVSNYVSNLLILDKTTVAFT